LAKEKAVAKKKDSEAAAVEAPPAGAKPATKSVKIGKLLPKNKSRLPRKEKKALQKKAQKKKA
jgi:hypothetical protein